MRIFNLSSAAERALASAMRQVSSRPSATAPSFTVRAASGAVLDAATATGAFRALRLLPPRDRDNARIYDDNGYCLYR